MNRTVKLPAALSPYTLFCVLLYALLCVLLCTGCSTGPSKSAKACFLEVGVLDGLGSNHTNMLEAYCASKLDSRINVRYVTSANIALGVLDSIDVLVVPGGGGSMHTFSLGNTNIEIIKRFADNGGGILCICAGAYALSFTPDYACFGMNAAQVVDLDHSSRGQALSSVSLTEEGRKLFPELAAADTLHILYMNGPMLAPADSAAMAGTPCQPYKVFATMLSDVHVGSEFPAGMSVGKPFMTGNGYGKGRVFTLVGHPEGSPSMGWMIPRILFWCAQKENMALDATHKAEYKAPYNNKEIILSNNDLTKEGSMYRTFVYGEEQEKLDGISWMRQHPSWSMKEWVSGLLYDSSPAVRAAAASYIADNDLIMVKQDLEAAWQAEKAPETKQAMEKAVNKLNSLYR